VSADPRDARSVPVLLEWALLAALALGFGTMESRVEDLECLAHQGECSAAFLLAVLVAYAATSWSGWWLAVRLADRSVRAGRLFGVPGMLEGLVLAIGLAAFGILGGVRVLEGALLFLSAMAFFFWGGTYFLGRRAGVTGVVGRDLRRPPARTMLLRMLLGRDAASTPPTPADGSKAPPSRPAVPPRRRHGRLIKRSRGRRPW
jgi:hypothetical protein